MGCMWNGKEFLHARIESNKMNYFVEWARHFVVHFGVWVSMGVLMTLHKDGLPNPKLIPRLMKSAIGLAFILSIFSSHSHMTYLNSFGGK
jgi:hypothetical protein